jgi:hypothetical protein
MCRKETENTAHFILQCARLQEVRKPFMDKVLSYLETNENLTPYVTDLLDDQNMVIVAGTVYNIHLWIRFLNSSLP